MNDGPPFVQLKIADSEVQRVSGILGLPEDAFYGKDGADPRNTVLKSMATMDIAACPGSGKTTLLVAKLAILAEEWRQGTRAICVLSHTNAARHQVESRLGSTSVGRRLLSYPHFIGTIHAFVNEFLALPWLRSRGYQVKIVDTDISIARRWYALPFKTRLGLENAGHDSTVLSIKSPNGDVGELPWGKGTLGRDKETYVNIRDVCLQSMAEGYFCFDEMFVWANDLMDKVPGVVRIIRGRFPLLFIDEAQDNSEQQSVILHRIFMNGDGPVTRQRFGDKNQAIFDFVKAQAAKTDAFPCEAVKTDLRNSFRFGPGIAKLADPLGIVPYTLVGLGPRRPLASGPLEGMHTVFLFSDHNAGRVLDAYGHLLLETFSESEVTAGVFTAVGMVHKRLADDHRPRHVGHYWADYDPELTNRDPKPNTFVQYLFAGIARAEAIGETHPATEKIAEATLRLAGMVDQATAWSRQLRDHRSILEVLKNQGSAQEDYEELIAVLVAKREALTKEMWENRWADVVRQIATVIAGIPLRPEANQFLVWHENLEAQAPATAIRNSRDNIYRFREAGREVAIRVGSIHSVKGETHTATLVLDTFWQDKKGRHNLGLLLSWLIGSNLGATSAGMQQQVRLKAHYVAMTRPTHLLCLAMKQSTFEKNGTLDRELIRKLTDRGWQVKVI